MSRPWALSVSNGSGAPWAADWTVLVVVSQGGQPRREWRSYSCLGLAQSRRVGCASTACRVSVDLVLASPEEGGARHALIWQYGGWLREPPLGAGLHGERPGWVVLLLNSPHLEWVHTQCAVGFALTRSLRSDAEMKFCTPSVVHAVTNPRTGARTAAFPFLFCSYSFLSHFQSALCTIFSPALRLETSTLSYFLQLHDDEPSRLHRSPTGSNTPLHATRQSFEEPPSLGRSPYVSRLCPLCPLFSIDVLRRTADTSFSL